MPRLNKTEISKIVRDLAKTLATFNAMDVTRDLERTRPDVIQHLKSRYRCDPYQQIKVWMPQPQGRP